MTEAETTGSAEEPQVLDAQGLYCPEPVMLLHQAMAPLGSGDRLRVLATDHTTARDIPQFCRHLGHELLEMREEGDMLVFELRKGPAESPR